MENKKPVIAITRPLNRSKYAIKIIEEFGGDYFLAPTLELKLSKTKSLEKLYENASKLDWLIFTSPASVVSIIKYFPDFKDKLNPSCKLAVIGTKTGECVEENGFKIDLIPENFTAEGLIDSFQSYDLNNKLVGLPRTLEARKILPEKLEEMGGNVIIAESYKSIIPEDTRQIKELIKKIISNEIDAITFTSPLTFKNLMKVADSEEKLKIKERLKNDIHIIAIGPITGNVIKDEGLKCHESSPHTVKEMLELTFKIIDNKN